MLACDMAIVLLPDLALLPDAGILGFSGNVPYVTGALGKLVQRIPVGQARTATSLLGQFLQSNKVEATVAAELMFHIPAAQLAMFVGFGITADTGMSTGIDSLIGYSGVVFNLKNTKEYASLVPGVSAGGGGGGYSISKSFFEGYSVWSIGRTLKRPTTGGASISGYIGSTVRLWNYNFGNCAINPYLAAGWGVATAFILGHKQSANMWVIGGAAALASIWPYYKWSSPSALRKRQME